MIGRDEREEQTKRLRSLAKALRVRVRRTWKVDQLGLPFGREALSSALDAAVRADHYHGLALDARDRDKRIRKALIAGINAASRICAEANLSPVAASAAAFAEEARLALTRQFRLELSRGSPGRVVQAAVAEATAQVWARERARPIPRSGKVAPQHELAVLLRAISADIFGAPGKLSVSLLRTPKK